MGAAGSSVVRRIWSERRSGEVVDAMRRAEPLSAVVQYAPAVRASRAEGRSYPLRRMAASPRSACGRTRLRFRELELRCGRDRAFPRVLFAGRKHPASGFAPGGVLARGEDGEILFC